jgi:hypothetical protein
VKGRSENIDAARPWICQIGGIQHFLEYLLDGITTRHTNPLHCPRQWPTHCDQSGSCRRDKSEKRRWSFICSYNVSSNRPYKQVRDYGHDGDLKTVPSGQSVHLRRRPSECPEARAFNLKNFQAD